MVNNAFKVTLVSVGFKRNLCVKFYVYKKNSRISISASTWESLTYIEVSLIDIDIADCVFVGRGYNVKADSGIKVVYYTTSHFNARCTTTYLNSPLFAQAY